MFAKRPAVKPSSQRNMRSGGQSLVEFALVFPVFLLLIFGLIDMGRFAYMNSTLSQAAREALEWRPWRLPGWAGPPRSATSLQARSALPISRRTGRMCSRQRIE